MKKLSVLPVSAVALVVVVIAFRLAAEHPADAAATAFDKARASYAVAEKRFLASAARIEDAAKRKQALKAFKDRKESWIKLSEADADFKIAASPLPETSNNSSLIPTWTEVHYLDLQTAQLKADADWLDANWK